MISPTHTHTQATLEIFSTVSEELLPTPTKSHYTFNLRDLAKVVQGILSGPADKIDSSEELLKLWAHECLRIFSDRLINDEDRLWFSNLLQKVMQSTFSKSLDTVVGDGADGNGLLLYGDFMVANAEPEKRQYIQLTDMKEVSNISHLDDY